MGKLTARQVSVLSNGEPGKYADGDGLYLVVPKSGKTYWMARYTSNGKRKEMTLAKLEDLSLKEARLESVLKMKALREGKDPLVTRKRANQEKIKTVNDLFADWFIDVANDSVADAIVNLKSS